ncbi:MAG: hypothetical protein BWY31_02003 [Lentisphaerae bacterium ADurb.Bin242]|nr:MAG: hypothetical protein BWY31_02003 [Lentisphaerae bacterium ADurb.Bin242]
MKRTIFVLILCAGFAAEGAKIEPPFQGDARPARNIMIGKKTVFTLKPGTKELEIVLAPEASRTTRFAAAELKTLLEQRLNTTIPVRAAPSGNGISFILGLQPLSKEAGIDKTLFCRDAFIIKSSGKRIYIAGIDDPRTDPAATLRMDIADQHYPRATLFGVYDFLERFAGIRFFFPGKFGTVIPKGTVEIPEISIFDRPDFEERRASIYDGIFSDDPNERTVLLTDHDGAKFFRTQPKQPNRNMDYLRFRMSTRWVPACHGITTLRFPRRFGKTHPEYFALDEQGLRYGDPKRPYPSQLCFNSDSPEVIYQDVKAFLSGQSAASRGIEQPFKRDNTFFYWHPQTHNEGVADLQPDDSYKECLCEKCRKRIGKTPREKSDFVWNYAINIAERLQKEKVDGWLTMMAYWPYDRIPSRKIPDNMFVMLSLRGPWSLGSPDEAKHHETLQAWHRALGRKVRLWNFALKWGNSALPGIPHSTPRHIGRYYRETAPWSCGAVLLTGGDYYIFSYLNHYIFSKVTWNASADVDTLLKDHCSAMFGAGAPEMLKFFDALEELWMKVAGKTVLTAAGPVNAIPSEYEIFTRIYSAEALKRLDVCCERARELASADPDSLERIRYIQAHFMNRLHEAASDYARRSDAVAAFRVRMLPLEPGEKVRLDGKLDDEVWRKRSPVFLQRMNRKPGTPQEETRAFLTFDEENIYVAFLCMEPEMNQIQTRIRKNDDPAIWSDNGVEIFLNPSGDRVNYYHIMMNSDGFVCDQKVRRAGNQSIFDPAWNSGIKPAVFRGKDFWSLEAAIPRSALPGFDGKTVIANFTRNQAKDSRIFHYSWTPFLENGYHDTEKFGTVVFTPEPDRSIVREGDFSGEKTHRNVFGAWVTHYYFPEGCFADYDDSTFIQGRRSLVLRTGNVPFFGVSQPLAFKSGTRYRLSYYVKLNNIRPAHRDGGVSMNIRESGKNRWFPQSGNFLSGESGWIRQSFEFTAGPDAGTQPGSIRPTLLSCDGSANFDAITVEELK